LGRYKKIYSFTIHGGIGHVQSASTIIHNVFDENTTSISSNFTAGTFVAGTGNEFGTLTFTANTSTKVRAIQVALDWKSGSTSDEATKSIIQGISFEYRRTNKFR